MQTRDAVEGKLYITKFNTIIGDCNKGCLKMIDITSFSKSLKAIWVKTYQTKRIKTRVSCFFSDLEFENFGREAVFTGNLNIKDTKNFLKVKDRFIEEVLTNWAENNFGDSITSVKHFFGQSLSNNSLSLIRIGDCPAFTLIGIVKVL